MAGTHVAGTYTSTYTLNAVGQFPFTLASTGLISVTSGVALIAEAGLAWSVLNQGRIEGASDGILLNGSGTVTNAVGATITASAGNGVSLASGGTVVNAGSIYGGNAGVQIYGAAGLVTNTGRIAGGAGVVLGAGGILVNGAAGATSATVSGNDTAVVLGGSAASVANYGTILGGFQAGVYLVTAGTVANAGTITGGQYGVELYGTAGTGQTVTNTGLIQGGIGVGADLGSGRHSAATVTVVNAGTIASTTGVAVNLGTAGGTLVVDPGAVFVGTVDGGITLGASGASILDLGSAAAAGTLTGLGTQFTNFSGVSIDAGANWTLAGTNVLTAGTVTNAGTLTMAGTGATPLTLAAGTTLFNAATGTITGASIVYEYLKNATGVSVTNLGVITSTPGSLGYGINLSTFGTVINGSATDTTARITGEDGGIYIGRSLGAVSNYGTVIGTGNGGNFHVHGIYIHSGSVNNIGSSAYIYGSVAGVVAWYSGQVINQGTIASGNYGIELLRVSAAAATVLNGTTSDTTALISGYHAGIYAQFAGATITNAGSITARATNGKGIETVSGAIVNGSQTDTSARIWGALDGLFVAGTVTVTNAATIAATGTAGIGANLYSGTIVNGSTADAMARIYGGLHGINVVSSATITNFATIAALGAAVLIGAAGTVVNQAGGIIQSTTANGVEIKGVGNLFNAGTITNQSASYSAVYLKAGGTITNLGSGLIQSAYHAVYVSGAGAIVNAAGGTLAGAQGAVDLTGGGVTLTNAGTIADTGATGAAVQFASSFANRLIIDPGATFIGAVSGGNAIGAASVSTLELAAGASPGTLSGLGTQFTDFAAVTIDTGATWSLAGTDTIAAGVTLTDSGTLTDTGTLLNNGTILTTTASYAQIAAPIAAAAGQTGTILITNTGKAVFQSSVASDQSVIFTGTTASGIVALATATAFAGTIDNFLPGDTIDLLGITATAGSLIAGNTLEIFPATGGTIDLRLAPTQNFAAETFHFAALPGGAGTALTATPCYLAGTRIRTDRGDRPVETLKPGDSVLTHSGAHRPIRWIGRRSFAAAFAAGNRDVIPIRIQAGALDDAIPARDLYVSPLHALFLDDALIPAELLVNGETIRRCPEIDPIRYFHIELDSHDILLAEGAPAESFVDCDSRAMFHNAATFDTARPAARWRFCAPRVESGPLLEKIRARIDARAGLAPPTAAGPLEGFLDAIAAGHIAGWARDSGAHPVRLEILVDGGLLARVTADLFREDLLTAGIGDGRHGFSVPLGAALAPDRRHEVVVRRADDGALLPGAPRAIDPVTAPDAATIAARLIEGAVDRTTDPAQARHLLASLRAATARLRARHDAPAPGGAGRRALVIDARLPRPDRDAGSVALLSHIAALRALGWAVTVLGADEPDLTEAAIAPLVALGAEPLGSPEIASVEEALRRAPDGFDLVYLHRLAQAESYAWLARRWQPRARILYALADLHHLRLERQARLAADAGLMAEARATRARELAAMRAADAVLTHSPEEAAYLAREAPGALVHVVPWAETGRPANLPFAARFGIALIGAPSHAPNLDAARWLDAEIMPLVWARAPDIPCYLVGEGWAAHWPAKADPRIRVLGPLARLDGLFEMVRLTVAPLRFGAGIKGKVLASLAAGLPCAMTPLAAEGLALPPPLRGMVAEDAAGIAALILRLHAEPAAAAAREAGIALVARRFGPDAVRRAMAAALRDRGASKRRRRG